MKNKRSSRKTKKIPILFERVFENHKKVGVLPSVAPGMEWVLLGEGIATEKIDGSCCAIRDGKFYKRYDAKRGKKPPIGAIPCCEPDEITGHWPHWVQVNTEDRGDMWHMAAYQNSNGSNLEDGTYEVVGPHFRNNPYGMEKGRSNEKRDFFSKPPLSSRTFTFTTNLTTNR